MDYDINLLLKTRNYYKIDRALHKARIMTMVLGICTILVLVLIVILKQGLVGKINQVTKQKQALKSELAGRKKDELIIKEINSKMLAMNKIVDDSPPYIEYYGLLQKHLPSSAEEGSLNRITMNYPNIAILELDFPSTLALSAFLGKLESKEFLNNFESIRFNNIIFSSDVETLSLTVQLSFKQKKDEKS